MLPRPELPSSPGAPRAREAQAHAASLAGTEAPRGGATVDGDLDEAAAADQGEALLVGHVRVAAPEGYARTADLGNHVSGRRGRVLDHLREVSAREARHEVAEAVDLDDPPFEAPVGQTSRSGKTEQDGIGDGRAELLDGHPRREMRRRRSEDISSMKDR